jgi:hypothetical protein
MSAEDDDQARKSCLRILRGMLGEGGLRAFLKCPQPEYGDMTGEQILVREPHVLSARLVDQQRGAA